ncbi:hypothetical protein ZEAMMB73_Zm00001d000003 [Zea mays]|nr:hypothetical protein ZEAMMB73_Zm00001d000003 [Zea mays]
MRQDHK